MTLFCIKFGSVPFNRNRANVQHSFPFYRNYDPRDVTSDNRRSVEKLLKERADSFTPAIAKRASAAAAPLATWVKTNVRFSYVLEKVKPLEQEQNKLQRYVVIEYCQLTPHSVQLPRSHLPYSSPLPLVLPSQVPFCPPPSLYSQFTPCILDRWSWLHPFEYILNKQRMFTLPHQTIIKHPRLIGLLTTYIQSLHCHQQEPGESWGTDRRAVSWAWGCGQGGGTAAAEAESLYQGGGWSGVPPQQGSGDHHCRRESGD